MKKIKYNEHKSVTNFPKPKTERPTYQFPKSNKNISTKQPEQDYVYFLAILRRLEEQFKQSTYFKFMNKEDQNYIINQLRLLDTIEEIWQYNKRRVKTE